MTPLSYQSGFGNAFATEALPGALPVGQNSPQVCPYGLYAEQLSGSAFTMTRFENRRSWLYRIRPSALQGCFQPCTELKHWHQQFGAGPITPNRLRWNPPELPDTPTDFLEGVMTWAGAGSSDQQSGLAINLYIANRSMNRVFYNADAEMLFVPQQGRLRLTTELGRLDLEPCEIALIPRGIRFRVELLDEAVRGYMLENFGAPLRLPELGPLGSNGLANARDFQYPVAWYEDHDHETELVAKFAGGFWTTRLGHSPLDVVAWHGTHAPCKYDLRRFNVMGSVSYDHPDPCIFSVLTSPSATAGAANIDVAIFPPRILAMEHSFRPPWFHRNVASEYMGLITGVYDAKSEGFMPGGASLHNSMTPHGPDAPTFDRASTADLSQVDRIRDTMAFMFESRWLLRPTDTALSSPLLQHSYDEVWSGLKKHFDPARPDATPAFRKE